MPDYFWNWYEEKGYENFLEKERCFENKSFLVGCCIEYLMEKGQTINNMHEYKDIEGLFHYLQLGVAWVH